MSAGSGSPCGTRTASRSRRAGTAWRWSRSPCGSARPPEPAPIARCGAPVRDIRVGSQPQPYSVGTGLLPSPERPAGLTLRSGEMRAKRWRVSCAPIGKVSPFCTPLYIARLLISRRRIGHPLRTRNRLCQFRVTSRCAGMFAAEPSRTLTAAGRFWESASERAPTPCNVHQAVQALQWPVPSGRRCPAGVTLRMHHWKRVLVSRRATRHMTGATL